MPRCSITGMVHMLALTLQVARPSMSCMLNPASCTAACAARTKSVMSSMPGASPQP